MTTAQRRLNRVNKQLVPPAVIPLIEVYTSRDRKWNSNHRTSAQSKLLEASTQVESVDELRDWMLNQRHSGILVEAWFAFRCFRHAPDDVLPEDELAIAKLVIEDYVRGWVSWKVNANDLH
jgi:hypothetical protein